MHLEDDVGLLDEKIGMHMVITVKRRGRRVRRD